MQRADTGSGQRNIELERLEALFEEVRLLAKRLRLPGNSTEPGDAVGAGEISVLRALSEQGTQTVPQIARLRGTSRQNIQILVNRLASQGLVEFSSNPAHKRSELVNL